MSGGPHAPVVGKGLYEQQSTPVLAVPGDVERGERFGGGVIVVHDDAHAVVQNHGLQVDGR